MEMTKVNNEEYCIPGSKSYLSEVIDELPSNCIINKGITGCGGTTVEIKSDRHSIILVPTINLALSKARQEKIFGFTGEVKESELKKYISVAKTHKIIATYDALPRLIKVIGSNIYDDYFLLIDEYHILFNSYSYRRQTIRFILSEYKNFNKFCFMTATPLTGGKILKEIEDLPIINYKWEGATPVNVEVRDCAFIKKELLSEIKKAKDYNLHIFINSIDFIKRMVKDIKGIPFRTICSKESGIKTPQINPQNVDSPVQKLNFYTAAAFEGCDIYDENGLSIIVSDSNKSHTVLDISTLVVQICGRIRNSRYKDEVLMIMNTRNHRYCKWASRPEFMEFVDENIKLGRAREQAFINGSEDLKQSELRTYVDSTYGSIYLIKEENQIKFDSNLKSMDIENFDIIRTIYTSSLNVIKAINNTPILKTKKVAILPLDSFTQEIYDSLEEFKRYTYDEITTLLKPIFKKHNTKINKTSIGRYLSPITDKKRVTTNGKKETIYIKK